MGGEEVRDGLDVDEELAGVEAADDGDPGDADPDENEDEGASNDQELIVRRSTSDPGPDVDGEDGGGGVEDGGEGGHQGRKHHCHHGTAHSNL